MKTAVLLIIFKRPDLTRRLIEILRRVKPPRLYIAADGPRPGRNEEETCAAARSEAARVDWECDVFTDFSDKNLGSAHRPATAITWFFQTETDGIILEDDCMPDDTFFRFCEEMLERYREDERVTVVSGYHGPAENSGDLPSYWFSKYPLTWGWATWRRAWRHFDINLASLPAWEAFKESGQFRKYCPDPVEHAYWIRKAESALSEYNAWDYQWVMTCWMRGGLSIAPVHNLIQNVGFGPDATHTTDDLLGQHLTTVKPLQWPLKHPAAVAADATYDHRTWLAVYRPFSILQRVHRKLLRAKQAILG